WTYDDPFACSIFVQHKNFYGITQVTVIKLIVANAMESHGRIRRHHEIEGGAGWLAIKKWCWEPARRNSLVADKGCARNRTWWGSSLSSARTSSALKSLVIRV